MTIRRIRTLLLGAAAGALLLTACGRHAPSVTAGAARGASEPESTGDMDPCSLLEPKEVEAALGAPLAAPPFRAADAGPAEDGGQCAYEDAHFHRIVVDVTWEGATFAWKMLGNIQSMINQGPTKGMLHLADGSDIAGTWDEARVERCCAFATLLGDQGVTIDAAGSNVAIGAAAKLADAALRRLGKPLAIDGNAGVRAARDFEAAHRPKPRDPCSLVTRAEAEALLGRLIAEPKAHGSACDYELPPQGIRQVYELHIDWSGGFAQFHENNALLAGFTRGMTANVSGAGRGEIEQLLEGTEAPVGPEPWEAAHASITGIAAVKDDVMMSIDTRGVKAANAARLLQKAMSRL